MADRAPERGHFRDTCSVGRAESTDHRRDQRRNERLGN